MKYIHHFFHKYGLFLTWIVACIATILSLYLGEVKRVIPCTLCWYQRIAVFPLVIILGIAAWRKETTIISYVLPLTLLGLIISAWHLLILRFPALLFACQDHMCSIHHAFIGYVTMPLAAFIGMIVINSSLILTSFSTKSINKLR